MRKLLLAGVVVLAACSARGEDGDPVGDRVGDWDTTLSPVNNSGVRGTTSAQSVGVGTGARISISNSTSGAVHPWHIHIGTCASSSGIVGSMGNYPALTVAANGTASAEATIGAALNEQSSYVVNVHRSSSDMTVVACGNLSND